MFVSQMGPACPGFFPTSKYFFSVSVSFILTLIIMGGCSDNCLGQVYDGEAGGGSRPPRPQRQSLPSITTYPVPNPLYYCTSFYLTTGSSWNRTDPYVDNPENFQILRFSPWRNDYQIIWAPLENLGTLGKSWNSGQIWHSKSTPYSNPPKYIHPIISNYILLCICE